MILGDCYCKKGIGIEAIVTNGRRKEVLPCAYVPHDIHNCNCQPPVSETAGKPEFLLKPALASQTLVDIRGKSDNIGRHGTVGTKLSALFR